MVQMLQDPQSGGWVRVRGHQKITAAPQRHRERVTVQSVGLYWNLEPVKSDKCARMITVENTIIMNSFLYN